jgi:hypothetical protein
MLGSRPARVKLTSRSGTEASYFAVLCESFASFAVKHSETAKFAKYDAKDRKEILSNSKLHQSDTVIRKQMLILGESEGFRR